jgi:hypothetical protein
VTGNLYVDYILKKAGVTETLFRNNSRQVRSLIQNLMSSGKSPSLSGVVITYAERIQKKHPVLRNSLVEVAERKLESLPMYDYRW